MKKRYLKFKYAIAGLIINGFINTISLLLISAEVNTDFSIKILIVKLISLLLLVISSYIILYILNNTKELEKFQA